MNTLSYGLLGLLARRSCTGYDLMLQLQTFWQAKHSQIYPLLAKLEQEGYVQFTRVEQSDKPDKKIYSITDKGRAMLKEWLTEPALAPATRDELYLKSYCLWLTDTDHARSLFVQRVQYYEESLYKFERQLTVLLAAHGREIEDIRSPYFGDYILLHKGIRSAKENIEWCKWVLQSLNRKNGSATLNESSEPL